MSLASHTTSRWFQLAAPVASLLPSTESLRAFFIGFKRGDITDHNDSFGVAAIALRYATKWTRNPALAERSQKSKGRANATNKFD